MKLMPMVNQPDLAQVLAAVPAMAADIKAMAVILSAVLKAVDLMARRAVLIFHQSLAMTYFRNLAEHKAVLVNGRRQNAVRIFHIICESTF